MQKNRDRRNQKGRLSEILCPQCKLPYLRSVARINAAAKAGRVMFCGISCYASFRATGESPDARARRFSAVSKRKYINYWKLKNSRKPFKEPFTEETYIRFIDDVEQRYGLTGQQAEAIMHVVRGRKHSNAAADMGLAVNTFRSHLSTAYMKLNVYNALQCVIILTPLLIKAEAVPASTMKYEMPFLPAGART